MSDHSAFRTRPRRSGDFNVERWTNSWVLVAHPSLRTGEPRGYSADDVESLLRAECDVVGAENVRVVMLKAEMTAELSELAPIHMNEAKDSEREPINERTARVDRGDPRRNAAARQAAHP